MKLQHSISRFLIYFAIYSLALAGIAYLLAKWLAPAQLLSPNFWLMFVFIFFLTVIAYVLSVFGLSKNPEVGTMTILGGMLIKMLFALSLFIFIRFKSDENLLVLGLNFFSIYLLFTVFEVISLLRILRHQIKR
ncbi:hypothetical protein C4F49_13830 [Sphingobacterium sp. KB22]|uniref:Uncharacterized protein n=1 Tax=Sphingobacterium hungaricum TaxID=2082723 RepID=A0A928YRK9_9SPHI|nr:hypothetical protein [Sphingobacterium hungaricum]